MNFRDLIELCARNLLRRRTRTVLAIVGVIVGTCAIVVMLSIGFGLTASYESQIANFGNLHMIQVYSSGNTGMTMAEDKGALTDRTIKAIENIEGVDAATPVISEYMAIIAGKKVTTTEVKGVRAEVLEKFNYELQEGELLKSSDKMGVLFGNQIPYWFYNPKKNDWSGDPTDVMGTKKLILTGDTSWGMDIRYAPGEQKIEYPEYEVKAVGVLANPNDESAYCVFMNIKDVEKIQKETRKARKESTTQIGEKKYDQALVYVGDIDDAAKISDILRDDMGFQAYSPSDYIEQVQDTARMIQGVLGGIGAISLLVAALGITNTMVMSIYERTKEIGVMKVIGANLKDIRRMFLLEAGMIGFIGGAVGVGLSLIISLLMNTVLKNIISMALGSIGGGYGETISIIPWWVVIGALAFATVIGLIAGFSPARRAMHLSALESLRNE